RCSSKVPYPAENGRYNGLCRKSKPLTGRLASPLRYVLRAPARDTENKIGLEKTNFQEKRMTKKQKGFSLIELLIVVAIILIIAAIAIPNLLRSRMAANEASAVGSI